MSERRLTRWASGLGMATALLLCPRANSTPPCEYEVTVLQYPIDCGVGTVLTNGFGLSDCGAVVGCYTCPLWRHDEAFLWTAEGGFVTLERPPGVYSAVANDVNDALVIAGTYQASGVGFRGFVYQDGSFIELSPDPGGAWSGANAISNNGEVVGYRSVGNGVNPFNAFVWSAANGFNDLGVMSGPNSSGMAVSATGAVAGWTGNSVLDGTAFVHNDGGVHELPKLPDITASFARAITSLDETAGGAVLEAGGLSIMRGFVWTEQGMAILDPLPGYEHSTAMDLAEHLCIVGQCTSEENPNDRRATLWLQNVAHDLNDLISPSSQVLLESARAANSAGQIVADGASAGIISTFLLTPVARPPTDFDGDCATGVLDLVILLTEWGSARSLADVNNDGVVDVVDLLMLLANWS